MGTRRWLNSSLPRPVHTDWNQTSLSQLWDRQRACEEKQISRVPCSRPLFLQVHLSVLSRALPTSLLSRTNFLILPAHCGCCMQPASPHLVAPSRSSTVSAPATVPFIFRILAKREAVPSAGPSSPPVKQPPQATSDGIFSLARSFWEKGLKRSVFKTTDDTREIQLMVHCSSSFHKHQIRDIQRHHRIYISRSNRLDTPSILTPEQILHLQLRTPSCLLHPLVKPGFTAGSSSISTTGFTVDNDLIHNESGDNSQTQDGRRFPLTTLFSWCMTPQPTVPIKH
ncbi:hypothetical protein CDV36_013483 [Fusarium kuroshium]|uniref:Uncharacterized protein n=1 Tax=Fusarium kuroshium TaxID=2010991 RepID=A0A3M2RNP5_9HYPO|nr:hypothetical protein CDV36_013483 [Fusarium kuroshium]